MDWSGSWKRCHSVAALGVRMLAYEDILCEQHHTLVYRSRSFANLFYIA